MFHTRFKVSVKLSGVNIEQMLEMASLCRPTDEEAEQLLQLMTSRPPATPAGVRFVSLSFCKLLAFPHLVRYRKTTTVNYCVFILDTHNSCLQFSNHVCLCCNV